MAGIWQGYGNHAPKYQPNVAFTCDMTRFNQPKPEDKTMLTSHIELFYALRIKVYTDVADTANASVAHIADFMLERWWMLFAESHAVEVSANGYTGP